GIGVARRLLMKASGPPSALKSSLYQSKIFESSAVLLAAEYLTPFSEFTYPFASFSNCSSSFAELNASRLSGGQLRLAQLSAKWTRGSLNFERIVSFSKALKLVSCPATLIRLPVKKVKKVSLTLLVGYFPSASCRIHAL